MESAHRAAVVAEAMSWLGTPYHTGAHVKRVGVDCAWLLIEVYAAEGLIERFDPGYYPGDWHLHRADERYLGFVLERAREVDAPDVGDIVLMRFGRAFSHGAIYLGDGLILHSYLQRPVDIAELAEWPNRPKRYFTVMA
jgi:cell wall-associated NlpC family hydrolase